MASVGGLGALAYQLLAPKAMRGVHQAVAGQRIERHARNLQAVKQNKVDLRQLLALPVYDPAHPYYLVKPWEVYFRAEQPAEARSAKATVRKTETMVWRDNACYDQTGMLHDDLLSEWPQTVRMAVRRLPKDQHHWRSRRQGLEARLEASGGYGHLPQEYWTEPSDDVAYLMPYVHMAADELEEKWGFMAGEKDSVY